jgi:hypothetical protein
MTNPRNIAPSATGLRTRRTRASQTPLNILHPPASPFRHSVIRHSDLIRHSCFVIRHSPTQVPS